MDGNYKWYIDEKVGQIGEEIALVSEVLSDEDILNIIEDKVFEDGEYIGCKVDEYYYIISNIFVKLRCKTGMLHYLIEDKEINEIMVNGPDNIFYEKNGQIFKYNDRFQSAEEVEEIIRKMASAVHREINEMNPIVDARLEDGSRINGVYSNVAINGPILTIRKFNKKHMTMEDMVRSNTITYECCKFLKTLVRCGYNIFVSGGTSSGKTTFLNALSEAIPKGERVIVIEDSAELQMDHIENLVQMECHGANVMGKGQVNMDALIRTSLRMRPDRIIVGEVRGKEVSEMLQAFNTGHDGSFSTGHGNSITGMLRRLEAMYLMSMNIPIDAIRAQIIEGIDVMLHLGRMADGSRKLIEISELLGYEDDRYILNRLFYLDDNMELQYTGNKLKSRDKLKLKGNRDDSRL